MLAEACHNLGQNIVAVRQLLAHVESGHLRVQACIEGKASRLTTLLAKYECMDVGDGTLVVLSERYPKAKIITVDTRDFPVYRRFDREPLPLIMPQLMQEIDRAMHPDWPRRHHGMISKVRQ